MTKDTSEPAFPAEEWIKSDDPQAINPVCHQGLSMRDYFAAKAMQGLIIANPVSGGGWPTFTEKTAYLIADAMLEARK